MKSMFYKCKRLSSLPDISKWNTNEVLDMTCIFYGCTSLLSFPDISKWHTNKVTDMISIFLDCSSLISKLIKFNISKLSNFKIIFLLSLII